MKTIKQVISEANLAIQLSESDDIESFSRRMDRIDTENRQKDEWSRAIDKGGGHISGPGNLTDFLSRFEKENEWDINNERRKQIRALINDILADADAKSTLQVPDFNFDMNNGLGQLPDMDFGLHSDFNVPSDKRIDVPSDEEIG